jgi:hypothetical protein
MTNDAIKHMVNRFLGWKLPENFNPDAGISFKAAFNEHTAHPMKHEPTGTNLFDATQADAMVRYMVEGSDDFRWLIEAPGQRYLAVQRLQMSDNFEWATDHNRALAFRTQDQADAMMMAVRQMDRQMNGFDKGLFAFEASLGNAKAVEHGWH